MFGKKNIEVNVILDQDLEMILQETNQYEDLFQGKIKCVSCKTNITMDNIGIIVPIKIDNILKVEFYCERIDCTETYKHTIE